MNAPNPAIATPQAYVDQGTHFEIERFLCREARLLDEERCREWLETLVHRDIHYCLPVREMRHRKDTAPIGSNCGTWVFNDNYDMLAARIARLETGLVWMEDPRNFMRRFISNIDAHWLQQPDELVAYSNFIVYRNRRQRDETTVWGGRRDRLRRVADGWQLVEREILVDQRVILDKNLLFFI